MKTKYPQITVVASSAGETITIDHRPPSELLPKGARLTGMFDRPTLGQKYWYWYPKEQQINRPGLPPGFVKTCRGTTGRRYHIIEMEEARLALFDDATGQWKPIPISQVKKLIEEVES